MVECQERASKCHLLLIISSVARLSWCCQIGAKSIHDSSHYCRPKILRDVVSAYFSPCRSGEKVSIIVESAAYKYSGPDGSVLR